MFRPLQALRAVWTYAQLVRDPNQLDVVFDLIASAQRDYDDILTKLRQNDAIARYLDDPWQMECPDLDVLGRLPADTLGRVFADHMRANNLDPKALFRDHGDGPIDHLNAHFEQTHDVWHALTGFTTDVQGELGLQAVYVGQIGGPPPVVILSAGLLHVAIRHPDDTQATLDAIAKGFAIGRDAKPLFGVRWPEYWDTPIGELRERFGLPAQPVPLLRAA